MSHSLQNLADQIRVAQDEALERRSHAPAEQRLARIHAELGRRSAAPRRVWTVTAAALVAAAAAVVVWMVSRPAVPLSAMAGGKSVEVNGYLHAANAEQALSFSDGTRLTLAQNAAVRVVSIDARGARVALEREADLRYLKKDDIAIEKAPQGWALVAFEGLPLGWIKGLKNRINNYFPKEWRIRMELGNAEE